ncbi:MAG TPA: hypothetical protein VG407_00495 [Caulobacteraceae bacterium]|nr:hypothetical protein [Caulobacteraceae bacterium]
MAEDAELAEGVLGGGEPEAVEADAAARLDPIAAALATSATEQGRPLDPNLAEYLARQRELIEVQTEHLHEQRELQFEHLRVRRWKDRLSLTIQALGVALGIVVFVALGSLVWRAHEDHGLVIQRFTAPPPFAVRGVGGDTVAADIVGKLSTIVSFVREHSFSSTNGVSTDTSNDVKIEIPETGVSLTEAWRLLREQLGSAKKVNGDLRDDGDDRITLTARLEGGEVFTATGPASDLGALEQNIAEQLYGATDPNNLAVYLIGKGRKADAFAAAARYAAAPLDRLDRANAVTMWGDLSDDPSREIRFGRIALRSVPDLMAAHFDVAEGDRALEHSEEALSEARAMLVARPQDQPRQHRGAGAAHLLSYAHTTIDELTGDFAAAVTDRPRYRAAAPDRPSLLLENAVDFARLHDPKTGLNLIEEAPVYGATDPSRERVARYDADVARADWSAALEDAKALTAGDQSALAASKDADEIAGLQVSLQRRDQPMLAVAEARTNDIAAAVTLIASTPADCYACILARGTIAASAGNAPDAERWFAEAIRQAPSLPFAQEALGEARLSRGDLDGAARAFHAAALRGPHWADPLKGQGDVAARRGQWRAARDAYDRALQLAPAWTELKQARASAAARVR